MEQYGGQTERERRTDGGSRAKRGRRTDGAACWEKNGGRGVKASGACAGQASGTRAGQAEQKGEAERARAGGASVFFAGCSAFVWESEEGLRFFGRNFDFDRFDAGSRVLFLPRGEEIALRLGEGVRETLSAKTICWVRSLIRAKDMCSEKFAALDRGASFLRAAMPW